MKSEENSPHRKISIVGAGIVGMLEAYLTFLAAKKNKELVRVTLYEKNQDISQTTTSHLVPALTPGEIFSVLPSGKTFLEKLEIPFEQGGLRVQDVEDLNESEVAKTFIEHVRQLSQEKSSISETRKAILLELGELSMKLWKTIYDEADDELKKILEASNFNPCFEPDKDELRRGYRLELILDTSQAEEIGKNKINIFKDSGYERCKILSPQEVIEIEPFLTDFCLFHSIEDESGNRYWKSGFLALWRPGGCIDTQAFLPRLVEYLRKNMGTYMNEEGVTKDCFQIKFGREVTGVTYDKETEINGLRFFNRTDIKQNKYPYKESQYVFCPGESVGRLNLLGFKEPPYSRFAGASLMLCIPNEDLKEEYRQLNQYMSVTQQNISFALQARVIESEEKSPYLFIGAAGGTAFYGDRTPNIEDKFAIEAPLRLLNEVNKLFPRVLSHLLNRQTQGQHLTQGDLIQLEGAGIATRWVGTRAVAYDGFPTLGFLYDKENGEQITNARCTTHLGSGGASFSPIIVKMSQSFFTPIKEEENSLLEKTLEHSRSNRP